jgi:hypothetical protein
MLANSSLLLLINMTAPELLKAQMPMIREIESSLEYHGYIKGTIEWDQMFRDMIGFYRKFSRFDTRPNQSTIQETA